MAQHSKASGFGSGSSAPNKTIILAETLAPDNWGSFSWGNPPLTDEEMAEYIDFLAWRANQP